MERSITKMIPGGLFAILALISAGERDYGRAVAATALACGAALVGRNRTGWKAWLGGALALAGTVLVLGIFLRRHHVL